MMWVLAFLLLVAQALGEDCVFNITRPHAPLILDKSFSFPHSYSSNLLHTLSGDLLHLVCPNGTLSPLLQKTGDIFMCVGQDEIFSTRSNKILDFSLIDCQDEVPANGFLAGSTCVTFPYHSITIMRDASSTTAYSVCFNNVTLTPFYVGYNTKYTCQECSYPVPGAFVDTGLIYLTNLDVVYTDQVNIFKRLGITDIVGSHLYKRRLFAGPFANPIMEMATYDYANHIFSFLDGPSTYQTYCDAILPPNVSGFVGTLGVLPYPKANGQYADMYLNTDTIPVPKWLWCVYYERQPWVDGDGAFYIDFGISRSSIPKEDIMAWWTAEICATDTYHYDEEKKEFSGNCAFNDTISPDLIAFLGQRFPKPNITLSLNEELKFGDY